MIDEILEAVEATIITDETMIADLAMTGEGTDLIETVPVEARMKEIVTKDDIEITVVDDAMIDAMIDTNIDNHVLRNKENNFALTNPSRSMNGTT